jgi:hypothetical protein
MSAPNRRPEMTVHHFIPSSLCLITPLAPPHTHTHNSPRSLEAACPAPSTSSCAPTTWTGPSLETRSPSLAAWWCALTWAHSHQAGSRYSKVCLCWGEGVMTQGCRSSSVFAAPASCSDCRRPWTCAEQQQAVRQCTLRPVLHV